MIAKKTAKQTTPSPPIDSRNRKMLRVSEVARIVDAHPNSVRNWADIGLLPSQRVGLRGDRRFKPEDVKVFLESFRRKSSHRLAHNGRRNG